MKIRVTRAQPRHVVTILDLMRQVHGEGNEMYPPLQYEFAVPSLALLINNHVVLTAWADKRLVAVMLLEKVRTFWNADRWTLSNTWFTVHPDFRKGGLAEHLVKSAKQAAQDLGLPLLIDIMSDEFPELKDRFVKMQGLKYVGGKFFWSAD